jgi:DNA polymerase elongation subunit (family B)
MIDLDIHEGRAYRFKVKQGFVHLYSPIKVDRLPDLPEKVTFDTEVRKAPIKKPKPGDPFNLLGFKYAGKGFMINNLAIHKVPIDPFWIGVKDGKVTTMSEEEARSPRHKFKPIYFEPVNVENENDLLKLWKRFIVEIDPKVVGGYNCDKFDWQHIVANGALQPEPVKFDDVLVLDDFEKAYTKDGHIYIDVIKFIERDSYLSKGNRGLKDVAKILMSIEPMEVNHEEVVTILDKIENEWGNPESPGYDAGRCKKEVQALANYCASDVFITAILLEDQITDLDISLSTIIPMSVFESARKKRGPMVEYMLLNRMHARGMIAPNKVKGSGKKAVNPGKEHSQGKDVFVEYKVKEDKGWARCVDTAWIDEHCKKCPHYMTCSKAFVDPITHGKRFRCAKTKEEMCLVVDADFPIDDYKFEGAYVAAFAVGVFKDNCPVKFRVKEERLKLFEGKMKKEILKEIMDLRKKGYVITADKYIAKITSAFEKIRSKCTVNADGVMEYHGHIMTLHVDVSSMYPSIIINFKLQPHGVVTPVICDSCPYHFKEGEAQCWVELPWNAVYDVIMIPPALKEKVDVYMQKHDVAPDKCIDTYKSAIKSAVASGKIQKMHKSKNTYKIPQVARFCQKAHTFFVDMVSDFREERLKYKRGEKDARAEIDTRWDACVETMPDEVKKQVKDLESRIKDLEKRIEDAITKENVPVSEIKGIINEAKILRNKRKWFVDEWKIRIDPVSRKSIDDLEIKAIYNRNAQLTYKVILNAIYGWLKSVGARLWSIEVTGCTTMKGQDVITWSTDFLDGACLKEELDSIDHDERLVFKDRDGLIRVESIGNFVDTSLEKNGRSMIDPGKEVEYADAMQGWQVLSVTANGMTEWQPVKLAIRQKTSRDVVKITTPFGSVRTTDSHSIFQNIMGNMQPFPVKDLKNQLITHACSVPAEEIATSINLARPSDIGSMFVFIPVAGSPAKWSGYPVSKLRDGLYSNNRSSYYRIPVKEFTGNTRDGYLVSTLKGMKLPASIPLTEDLAELMGWYVAEGTTGIYNGKIYTAMTQKRGNNLNRIMELCSIVAKYTHGFDPHAALGDRESDTMRVGLDNVFFHHLFNASGCGSNSFSKRIPPEILSAPKNIKVAFLRGYFTGDGAWQGKHVAFTTVNDGLRDDLFVIGKQLGYIVTIKDGVSSLSGNVFHVVNFITRKSWELGSRAHYEFNEIGKTIGLQPVTTEIVKKTSDYVYDISVEKNNNFVSANGGILCHNTDGIWSAFPVDLPTEISIVNEKGIQKKVKMNVFNAMLNDSVKEKFTNYNNYEWDEETQSHVNKPQCYIKFDAEGPYSMFFVQRKKRYTAYERERDDPTEQKVAEVKGMDQKRKGEIQMLKDLEIEVANAYKDGENYDECYGNAITVLEQYVDEIENRTLPPLLIYEARDMKSVAVAQKAYSVLHDLEASKKYDPEIVPACNDLIQASSLPKDVKRAINDVLGSKAKSMQTRHAAGCLRILDLGIDVSDGETVQWIVSRYPENVGSVTQRIIPTILFDADDATIRKYLKRWIGYDVPETYDIDGLIRGVIDWDYYLERLASKSTNIVIIPFEKQKNYVTSPDIREKMATVKSRFDPKPKKPVDKPGSIGGDLVNIITSLPASRPVTGDDVKQVNKEVAAKMKKKISLTDFL